MALKTLLIEEHETIRTNLIPALEELGNLKILGIGVTERGAVQLMEQFAASWQIVVVDLFLEQGSGLGVLKACANRLCYQKAFVLTNYPTAEMRRRCKELGADGMFDKSNELDAFFEACLSVMPPRSFESS